MSRLNNLTYADDQLQEMLELLDQLHTAASENTLHHLVTANQQEVIGMLREVIYTAQEAISEIETGQAAHHPPNTPANVVQFVSPDTTQESRHA